MANRVEWNTSDFEIYPTITVCNAKYFDKRLLSRKTTILI